MLPVCNYVTQGKARRGIRCRSKANNNKIENSAPPAESIKAVHHPKRQSEKRQYMRATLQQQQTYVRTVHKKKKKKKAKRSVTTQEIIAAWARARNEENIQPRDEKPVIWRSNNNNE